MADDPTKGLKYLYLTDADHAALSGAEGGPSYRAESLTAPDGEFVASGSRFSGLDQEVGDQNFGAH